MKEIKLKFSDNLAGSAAYYLGELYGKDKRTPLRKLCQIAIHRELRKAINNEMKRLDKK